MESSIDPSQSAGSLPEGTTRREFFSRSLLGGAAAVLASELGGKGLASEAGAGRGPAAAETRPGPYPVVPYGSGEPLYLGDLDRCEPASALDRSWTPHRWRLIDYRSEKVSGTLIASGQITGVPDLTYRLDRRGWYGISFGLLSFNTESRIEVRLGREPDFVILTPNDMADLQTSWNDIQFGNHDYRSDGIEELFWKYAELGVGDSIVLRQLKVQFVAGDPDANGNCFVPSAVAYIKLVPLSGAEVPALEADRRRRDTRRLFATDDANSVAGFYNLRGPEDIRRQLEPYRHTDFSRMYWEAGMGDLTYYPSKIGTFLTFKWRKGFQRRYERLIAESYGGLEAKGIDPFRVALDHCHEMGLEFHASYRVAGFHWPSPEDEWRVNGLYDRHPEWRCLDRDGRPTPRLSYAFAGVRQYVLSLLREVVTRYPVEGVCLLYNRRMPIVGSEAANPGAVLTGFMRELRQAMGDEEKRQGRGPIGITAVVLGSKAENEGYGIDLGAWIREGLVDTLVPYTSAPDGDGLPRSWEDPRTAEYFIELTRGTNCRLALNLMPRNVPPEEYKRRANALYRMGADSLFFWDTYQRANFDRSWSTLGRLGHREELAEWAARGSPGVERPGSRLLRLGDWEMAYKTPG